MKSKPSATYVSSTARSGWCCRIDILQLLTIRRMHARLLYMQNGRLERTHYLYNDFAALMMLFTDCVRTTSVSLQQRQSCR